MTDKKISIKWIEVILLIAILLIGVALTSIATSFIDSERELSRPREEAFGRDTQLLLRQSELATAQAELSTLRSKIMDQQFEVAKATAKLEALKASYPALNAIQNVNADINLNPEIKTAFRQGQIDLDSTKRVLNDLNARAPAVTATATQKAIDANVAQEASHKDFEKAQNRFQLRTRGIVFVASIVLSLMILVVASLVVLYLNSKEGFEIRNKVVLLSSLGILLALTSYQTFQVAGATVVIIVILLVAAMLGLRGAKEEGTK